MVENWNSASSDGESHDIRYKFRDITEVGFDQSMTEPQIHTYGDWRDTTEFSRIQLRNDLMGSDPIYN